MLGSTQLQLQYAFFRRLGLRVGVFFIIMGFFLGLCPAETGQEQTSRQSHRVTVCLFCSRGFFQRPTSFWRGASLATLRPGCCHGRWLQFSEYSNYRNSRTGLRVRTWCRNNFFGLCSRSRFHDRLRTNRKRPRSCWGQRNCNCNTPFSGFWLCGRVFFLS